MSRVVNLMTSRPKLIQPRWLARFPELRCGVSTRNGGVSPDPMGLNLSFHVGDKPGNVEKNRNLFFGGLDIPLEKVAFTRQVHSAVVQAAQHAGIYENCDALMTNQPDLYLAISVADCLPILLYDQTTATIAAIHSGWRGSKANIVGRGIALMQEKYDATPGTMVAYIGPSAGVCCYEVGEEVAADFEPTYLRRLNAAKPHLDLKRFNHDLMVHAGIAEKNIEVSDYCTICNADLFHSFRRDDRRAGRMIALIGRRRMS